MKKKVNSDLDLDFNDIVNSKKEKIIKKSKKETNRKSSISSIPLSIPISGNSNQFISKTIAQCSAKEFVRWSNKVAYPIGAISDLESFSSVKNRVTHFLEVLNHHRRKFLITNPDSYRTFH